MYNKRKHLKVTSSETDGIYWRRVELTDLPKLKKMMNKESSELFGVFDMARIITNNPLALCQVNPSGKISIFMSVSDRPNISCIASDDWTEWFNNVYDLKNVEQHNTLFVDVLLFRCVDSLIHLPVLLETVYVQIPLTKNIILVKRPGTRICEEMCEPFATLSAKNVTVDPEFGRPEILYHTRALSINKINLRTSEVDDFIDLRAYLGHRLDFLDSFYGEYSLAKILEFPGEGRVHLVPNIRTNGLMTMYTHLDYALLDSAFDLYQFAGLIELKDEKQNNTIKPKRILRLPADVSKIMEKEKLSNTAANVQYELISNQSKELNEKNEKMKHFFQINSLQKDGDTFSAETQIPVEIPTSISKNKKKKNAIEMCYSENKNIIKDFMKFQESKKANDSSYYSSNHSQANITYTNMDYKRTAFMIELMLIDAEDENKASWDYLASIFSHFIEYEYCLMNFHTIAIPPKFKKFFFKATLKPNRFYPMGLLYILHRSLLTGTFSCVMVTKNHLEIMELMIENHPFKHVISNNISKSVFEDTRYKTYIFQCNNQPIGYCIIRLDDEMKFLSSYFDVTRYAYPKQARNHMAVLLNMDLQKIFFKKSRGLLKFVMDDSDVNCLFYKLYSDPIIMEQYEVSYVTEIKELIPVKPRARIQYDDEDFSCDHGKFALFHINTRLCRTQPMSIDAKIVVVGGSVVALSLIESLLFSPVNCNIRVDNIVLISDCGAPYRLKLTNLEDRMVPITSHFNHEYMISMGFKSFVDVITGTVTAINRADKYVTVNEDEQVYYDYLFLFYGEQFGYSVDENKTKSTSIKSSDEHNTLENLFFLNSEHDVTHAYNYIKSLKNNKKDIIVYGMYLGSLSVINVLLESNIDGSRIVYAETVAKENIPFITNQLIVNTVYGELFKQGVRVYKKCVFDKLTLNGDQTSIRKVTFKTNNELLTIDCAALFWFDQKFVNKVNWFTILQSAMKFDGHLVVNTSFETTIEYVYAAGPVARFMRNDYFTVPNHTYYNRLEMGARVANVLMKRLGILEDDRTNDEYVRPLFVYCQLPGKFNYLHAEVPFLRSMKAFTKSLSTGNATDGYFEIVVNSTGEVLELSCYSNKDFKYLNLINLCGKHVNLFNDMMNRFKTNSIPCFFDYFNQPWAYILYSDKFWKLLDEIKPINNDKHIKELLGDDDAKSKLISKLNVNMMSVLSRRIDFDRRFDQLYGEKLENILMNFVIDNVDDFPMFSHTADRMQTED